MEELEYIHPLKLSKMIKTSFLFLTILFTVSAEVTVLTNDNFKSHINSNEYVLVKFYAPWCGHCKKLAPHYEKLSTEGVKGVSITKVDATVETTLASSHGIKGYPTLKWFINGTEYDFKGGRDFESMNSFLKKATGEWASFVEDNSKLDELLNSMEDEDVLVVSNIDESDLRPLSSKVDSLDFVHVKNNDVLPENTLRVYNKFGPTVNYQEYSEGDKLEFIQKSSLPLVSKLDSKAIKRGFGYSRKHVIIFTSDGERDKVVDTVSPVSEKYTPKYIFVTVKDTNKQVVDMFGVKEFPAVFLVNLAPKLVKYRMDSSLSTETLEEHIKKYENGELVPELKSEEVPEQEEGKPYVLVGKTFDKFVKEKNNVFVKFYAPWCGHCKRLAPTWDDLAEKVKDSGIVIAKYDATANENESVDVKGFPTLKYYKNGNAIDYSGARDLESLKKFALEQLGETSPQDGHSEL